MENCGRIPGSMLHVTKPLLLPRLCQKIASCLPLPPSPLSLPSPIHLTYISLTNQPRPISSTPHTLTLVISTFHSIHLWMVIPPLVAAFHRSESITSLPGDPATAISPVPAGPDLTIHSAPQNRPTVLTLLLGKGCYYI